MNIKSTIFTPLGFVASVVLVLTALVIVMPLTASAAETKTETKTTKTETKKPAASSSSKTYEYVAQSGDSYTKMARKAVQTYGITNKVTLSNAEIIFAETNLTQQASSPVLNLGQKVSINKDAVKNWVEKAQKITPAQEASWNYYVKFVNFNTNKVGEA